MGDRNLNKLGCCMPSVCLAVALHHSQSNLGHMEVYGGACGAYEGMQRFRCIEMYGGELG